MGLGENAESPKLFFYHLFWMVYTLPTFLGGLFFVCRNVDPNKSPHKGGMYLRMRKDLI